MRPKIGLLLIIVILVQVFFLQFVQLFNIVNHYLAYVYITTSYVVIAVLIWSEIKQLHEYHLEKFTLFLFIFSSLVRRRLGINGEVYFLLIIALSGLSVIVVMLLNRTCIPKNKIRWALAGAFWGCVLLILTVLCESFQWKIWIDKTLISDNIALIILRQVVFNYSFGVIVEEMIYRGFLWGYLRKIGWEEKKIIWGQGILFWLSHLYRIRTPITFFLTIPLLTFVSSKLVQRSRQVFPSILSHLITNTMAPILLNIFWVKIY
jgi:membrane protease YdiL (CAAX protease family)